MATITIKIESDALAREVLTHLGYLPGDDEICVKSDDPFIFTKTASSRDAFAAPPIRSALDVQSVEPGAEGFGTPLDQTDVDPSVQETYIAAVEKELDKKEWQTRLEFRAIAAAMKERLSHQQYIQYLETCENDNKVAKELIQSEKASVATAVKKMKEIADELICGELKDYLDAVCEDEDEPEDVRAAAREYLSSMN